MKKNLCVLYLFLFVSLLSFAGGSKEEPDKLMKNFKPKVFGTYKLKHKASRVEFPKGAELGDFITVRFHSRREIKKAWVSFINENNNAIQTIRAFPINEKKTEWVAVAGIAVWWKPDLWQIKTKFLLEEDVFEDLKPFIVANKKFPEFVMKISKKNTKIIKSKSKKKTIQRNRFREVIGSTDYNAKLCSGPFIKPFKFTRISSPFAQKRIRKYSNGSRSTGRHWGMDYPAKKGTPVKAPCDGKVVLSEERVVTGNTLILEHLPGVYTIYYHLNEIYVKEGEFLKQGSVMAAVGSTGFSTGPHLHWELRINQIPVDPRHLLLKKFY